MSTRGVIAVATSRGHWEGVYNHHDSYPTGLGKMLWDELQEYGPEEVVRFAIRDHPGGWSCFPENCYCCHPEFADRREGEAAWSGRLTDETVAPDLSEWGYLIDPERGAMTILVPRMTKQRRIIRRKHGWWEEPVFRWLTFVTIPLAEDEPNWEAFQHTAMFLPDEGPTLDELAQWMAVRPWPQKGRQIEAFQEADEGDRRDSEGGIIGANEAVYDKGGAA